MRRWAKHLQWKPALETSPVLAASMNRPYPPQGRTGVGVVDRKASVLP